MARYAENLIGDWEKDQYEPLRDVAQLQYNTDWDKLTNDFNRLNEQLAQNFKNARIEHNKALIDNAQNSYMRLYNAERDLAKRGLTGSGLMNVYNAANTAQIGEENNKALKALMEANKATMEGSLSGLDKYSRSVADLAGDLGDQLAGITDAEGDNLRQYANLVSDITESERSRALRNTEANAEDESDKLYQLYTINEILLDEETTDDEKYYDLLRDAGTTPEQAERIISSYNHSKVSQTVNKFDNKLARTNANLSKLKPGQRSPLLVDYYTKKLNDAKTDLSKYTYEDLKNIMGY